MKRTIIKLIITLCVLIELVNGLQFLNLIPYKSSDCSEPASGTGFSSVIDTCITYDYQNNFVFKVFKDMVSIESFKSPNGEQVCQSQDSNKAPIKFQINACLPYLEIGNLNLNYQLTDPYVSSGSGSYSYYTGSSSGSSGSGSGSGSASSTGSSTGSSSYYPSSSSEIDSEYSFKVTLTNGGPSIPTNSYVTSFMANQCTTDSSNALIFYYFTNGTWLYERYNLFKSIYYCSNKTPYQFGFKELEPQDMSINCNRYAPFFNSSYEVYPSSEATGCYTSSGGNSCGGDDDSSSTGYSGSSTGSNSINGETSGSGTSGSGNSGRSITSGGSIITSTTSSSNSNSNSNSNHVTSSGSAYFDDSSEEISYQNVYCT
ncbi:hypothetical protein ACTFIU_007273 [Dictyostelium citrinum]